MRLPPDELKALDRWIMDGSGALLCRELQASVRRKVTYARCDKNLQSVECPGLRHSNALSDCNWSHD